MESGYATSIQDQSQRWSVGQRVKRLNDGAPGVVSELGSRGNICVVWDASGIETLINALQVEPG